MKISIIIVSYNVRHYLWQCLRSVWRALEGIEGEVFVVDNASHDGSIAALRTAFPAAEFPHLHLIASTRNLGFGRANNVALRECTGHYVLFLNPDTVLGVDTLHRVLSFADGKEDLGALGVRMLSDAGRFALESRRGIPTPWTAFCKMCGLGSLFPRSRTLGRYYMRWLDEREAAEVEIVSGAFMLCRRDALEAAEGFDERFFMYGEDIDLSYRLLQQGRHNYYVPAPILHYKGESTHKNSYRYVHVFYEAMLIFFKKHYRHATPFLSLPIKTAILLRAAMALGAMGMRRLGKFLWPRGRGESAVFLYAGSHREALERLAAVSDFRITDRDVDEPLITVLDADDRTYGEMLHMMESSSHKRHLGIFYPDENLLITGGDIYTLNDTMP